MLLYLSQGNPVVNTVEGSLRGCVRKNLDGEDFYCFLGVKYAKAPVGNLRFKPPQPVESWTGIRDAIQEGEPFIQKDFISGTVLGCEDALHLNIYTKKFSPDSTHLKPVMVWIHGGAYIEGHNSLTLYGPDYLLLEDIVLVVINYRLGVLGFLSFQDPNLETCCNVGMKDQVEALKWVKRNIKNFGGDPSNVTIFGESAGGSSVHYHVTSPLSQGLFHKAIMQSGTQLAFWSQGKRYVGEFMEFLGKNDLTEHEQFDYLTNLPIEELFKRHSDFIDSLPSKSLQVVGPVIEKVNDAAFLTQSPMDGMTGGHYKKIPILLGYNSHECLFFSIEAIRDGIPMKGMTKAQMIDHAFNFQLNDQQIERLNEVYVNYDDEFKFMSDLYFIMATINAALVHSKISDAPVFLYRMSLSAGLNYLMKKMQLTNLKGAIHADDCGYLFSNSISPVPEKGTLEDISVRRFVKLWTNFAKFGNPTPNEHELKVIWKPFDEKEEHFLDIDAELSLQTKPEKQRTEFWREIFSTNII